MQVTFTRWSCGHIFLMLKVVFLDTAKPLLKKYFLTVKNESLQSCSPFILSFLLEWGLLFCDFWPINGKSLERQSWVLWPSYHTVTWHGFPHTAAVTLLLMFLLPVLNSELGEASLGPLTHRSVGQIFQHHKNLTCLYRWLINTWKDAQHHLLLEKYKPKLESGITSHQSEWPSTKKNLQIINAGEDMEKREPSCTAGGNVNWYSHYWRWYGEFFKN